MKYLKRICAIMIAVSMMAVMLTGCKTSTKGHKVATMKIKGFGEIIIELYPEKAPKAVENFVTHAKNGYYDGLTFHRVMNDFMIQGGDPDGNGLGGKSIWGKPFEDEFSDLRNYTGALSMANSGPATNGSQFFIVRGQPITVSDEIVEAFKSNNIETDTNYAKELLNAIRRNPYELPEIDYSKDDCKKYEKVGGAPWLDNVHTVFGYVTKGMDIVDKVMQTPVDGNAMPTTPVIIESIKITDK